MKHNIQIYFTVLLLLCCNEAIAKKIIRKNNSPVIVSDVPIMQFNNMPEIKLSTDEAGMVRTEFGSTALIDAAATGNEYLVTALAAYNKNINAKDDGGATALHMAARTKNLVIAKILLTHKADVNAEDGEGFTPLMRAAMNNATELVSLFLNNGAEPLKTNIWQESAIIAAANADCVQCLSAISNRTTIIARNSNNKNTFDRLRTELEKAAVVSSRNYSDKSNKNPMLVAITSAITKTNEARGMIVSQKTDTKKILNEIMKSGNLDNIKTETTIQNNANPKFKLKLKNVQTKLSNTEKLPQILPQKQEPKFRLNASSQKKAVIDNKRITADITIATTDIHNLSLFIEKYNASQDGERVELILMKNKTVSIGYFSSANDAAIFCAIQQISEPRYCVISELSQKDNN